MDKVEIKIKHMVWRTLGILLCTIVIFLIGLAFLLIFFKVFLDWPSK